MSEPTTSRLLHTAGTPPLCSAADSPGTLRDYSASPAPASTTSSLLRCPHAAPALPDMATAFAPCHLHQNCHPECEAAINNQVNLEVHASFAYKSMASYFDRGDAALKHFSLFFLDQSKKKMEHVDYLLGLQNQRGSNPRLWNIPMPEEENWENGLRVLECALQLAKRVQQSLLSLHQVAKEKHGHVCNFLEGGYLFEQVMFMRELRDHIANLRKLEAQDDGLTESLSDKLTLGDSEN
ncbi:ferritin heavy chain-like [Phyllostomus discolor]|uniref:Ferritin n=1 Tax=Phyllostomus discolor TaxID=89673 RepID=A0A7E6D0Q0_9CHIR|nr:ferritin heavy chain-like [Phyllostomus discolor]